MKTKTTVSMTVAVLFSLFVSACGGSSADATPTFTVEEVQTMAVAVFSVGLTQTALAAPTNTLTPPNTAAPTLSIPTLGNVTPFGASTVSVNPVSVCNGLSFVSDVTIPDNTPMTPGQAFTKTWKVRNSGTCAWDAGFKFVFTNGDAMGGATSILLQAVPAGTQTDISIPMTAPNKAGSIKGSWRMSTAAGQSFGDEVYLVILVGGAGSPATNTGAPALSTSTSTPTPTPTATETPIPAIAP
jgi:Ig-like domain from next to BRCA1 gene